MELNTPIEGYRDGMTIYLLLTADQCRSLVEDWVECNYRCPLHVERSKRNPGKYVVTTKCVLWAVRIIRWHGYEKVSFRS